ncbi:hypothetical protein AT959_03065 [Dechloromonas denitrificans]|uniref:Uncharacterized protein n=1 Tax=Dechloromonas denitrificans TaxID=281362 RepID=A0A133XMB3_9RHOO|nr:hypothetical protein [Dechloromonas denitrificans]KXB32056.1 hypothetical protein AT959_03065 [Dechloromonas denitrificans]
MASLNRNQGASPNASVQVGRDTSRAGDAELSNFDLRDALADITVRETSFSEFLAALRQNGQRPA